MVIEKTKFYLIVFLISNMSAPTIEEVKDSLTQVCKTLDGKEWVLGNATLSGKGYTELGQVLSSYCHLRYLDASNNDLGSGETAGELAAEEEAEAPAEEDGEAAPSGEDGAEAAAEEAPPAPAHPLQALTGLTSVLALNLSTNSILTFPKEFKLLNLQIANVSKNRITDIPFNAESAPSLMNLDISENSLAAVEGMDGLSSLRTLKMNDNIAVSSLSGLGNLISLEKLNASKCDLQDLNGLEGLSRSFADLDVSGNKIALLGGLSSASATLVGLKIINLADNAIENLDELKILNKFSGLETINLLGNPCAETEEFRTEVLLRVPFLKSLSGEDVTPEERAAAKDLAKQRKEEAAAAAAAAAEAAAEEEGEEDE